MEEKTQEVQAQELIRLPEVMKMTCLSRAGVYKLIKDNKFPRQTKMTPRCSVWIKSEIQDFINEKINMRPVG